MSKSILEMYLQCEIQAVMRIKQQFFKWFEEFFTKTTSIFLGQQASQQLNVPDRSNSFNEDDEFGRQIQIRDDESSDSMLSC